MILTGVYIQPEKSNSMCCNCNLWKGWDPERGMVFTQGQGQVAWGCLQARNTLLAQGMRTDAG